MSWDVSGCPRTAKASKDRWPFPDVNWFSSVICGPVRLFWVWKKKLTGYGLGYQIWDQRTGLSNTTKTSYAIFVVY